MLSIVALASAAEPDAPIDPLIDSLVASPDHDARRAKLTARVGEATDPDALARYSAALVALASLDAAGRRDPAVIQSFLEAALSTDPGVRAQALEAARDGGAPPRIGEPSPAPTAASPEAIRRYQREHLYRDKLQSSVTTGFVGYYGGSVATENVFEWAVYEGGGRLLSTPEFHDRVGDDAGRRRYRAGVARRTSIGTALTAIGTAAVLGGMGAMFASLDEAVPDGMLWVGTGVATAGSVPLGVGIGQFVFNNRHKRFVYTEYAPDEADAWVDRHNDDLIQRLGLAHEDVAHIVP